MAPPDAQALRAMNQVIETASILLQQLQNLLGDVQKDSARPSSADQPQEAPSSSSPPEALDALAIARDSASLIKAHTTKLSLLIINKPFSPSAVVTVVRDLTKGPIPGLASSAQACDAHLYTAVVRRELAWRSQKVFSELGGLLQKVPKDGETLSGGKRDGSVSDGKGSLVATGVLWSACDDVVQLANIGVEGFLIKKVEDWRDTLKDVMEELKEWGDEEPDDDEEDDEDEDVADLADDLGGSHISTQAMLDDLMSSNPTIPRSDPNGIRPRLESSLKRLRLVVLLYQAITKRRLKKLPSLPMRDSISTIPQRLDEVARVLQQLPDKFGDLAEAFYELKPAEIDAAIKECFTQASAAGQLLSQSWDGSQDEFTEWTKKFQAEIKKT
ncbi:hypothetical protein G7046_g2502 [Stylonectria norvegica]|nr:hypothetical protein G7046_g2502 [Stylonectria norvegica]